MLSIVVGGNFAVSFLKVRARQVGTWFVCVKTFNPTCLAPTLLANLKRVILSEITMTANPAKTIYDEVPYPSVSHSLSHPDRLATLATMLGLEPAPVEHCRVLEVGCAGGGNLLPMAEALPESEFVGIDSSARQIAEGQTMLAALELPNVTLNCMNILDVTADLGQFDYIIAHGVYSWVPAEVRDKLLDICRQHLSPNGVAYISYNTYPGWNMLGSLREMMLYHTRQATNPQAQAAEARALLEFLTRSISTESNNHSGFLYVYVNYIKEFFMPKDDAFLLHDELAEINDPVYFYQFAEQAARHGLQYLGDVNFQSMLASNFPTDVVEGLRQMAKSTVELEQYMDFLRDRMFRQSLLCHQDVRLSARMGPERLSRFYIASSALPESTEPDIHTVSVEKFCSPDGANLVTDHPITKAAMLHLIKIWPRSIAFEALLTEAQARLGQKPTPQEAAVDAQVLGANLLKAYGYSENLVELHVYQARFAAAVSRYPVTGPVARFQARHNHPLTNLRHERITLDKVGLALLPYLDGSQDRAALIDILEEKKMIEVERKDGQPVEDREERRNVLAEIVNTKLQQFADAALLIK